MTRSPPDCMQETVLVQAKDREIALLQQQLGVSRILRLREITPSRCMQEEELMSVADKENEMPHTQDEV